MPTAADRIASLEKKREQIAAQISDLKARETAKKKKDDTRIKVLLGAWVLHRIETGDLELRGRVQNELQNFLTREVDKGFAEKMLGLWSPLSPS